MFLSIQRCCNFVNNPSSIKNWGKSKYDSFYSINSEESLDQFDEHKNRGRNFYSEISPCVQEAEPPYCEYDKIEKEYVEK